MFAVGSLEDVISAAAKIKTHLLLLGKRAISPQSKISSKRSLILLHLSTCSS